MNEAQEKLLSLYLEVINFLRSCGGSYRNLDAKTCLNIADCLDKGRFLIQRQEGQLARVMLFWLVRPEDLPLVEQGLAPEERERGSILYIAEHAGVNGSAGLRAAISELKKKYDCGCWHDRWLEPGRFRIRRKP